MVHQLAALLGMQRRRHFLASQITATGRLFLDYRSHPEPGRPVGFRSLRAAHRTRGNAFFSPFSVRFTERTLVRSCPTHIGSRTGASRVLLVHGSLFPELLRAPVLRRHGGILPSRGIPLSRSHELRRRSGRRNFLCRFRYEEARAPDSHVTLDVAKGEQFKERHSVRRSSRYLINLEV